MAFLLYGWLLMALIWLAVQALFGWAGAAIIKSKGRAPVIGFLLGFFFGVFGIIVAAFIPRAQPAPSFGHYPPSSYVRYPPPPYGAQPPGMYTHRPYPPPYPPYPPYPPSAVQDRPRSSILPADEELGDRRWHDRWQPPDDRRS